MPLDFYKVLHYVALFGMFTSLGGLIIGSGLGWGSTGLRRSLVAVHGIAMLVLLVAGFGALAKLGGGMPGWVWAKLVLWLVLGAVVVPIRRMPSAATLWLLLVPLLGLGGAWLAVYKPF